MAAVAFTLCGFQAIHSSHEPFYCLLPYLPLALGIAERFLATGRLGWLAALPLTLGLQWTLGHFQIQTWTGGLVIADRTLAGRVRSPALGAGVRADRSRSSGESALAAVQLGPSWQFSELVGQTQRTGQRPALLFVATRDTGSSRPCPGWSANCASDPRIRTGSVSRPRDIEAVLYVGTIPLILAFIGGLARPSNRATMPWRLLIPVSFAIATMPRWWPQGYLYLLSLPGLGYFRVPARYTLLTCLGIALLAGEGFDRSVSTVAVPSGTGRVDRLRRVRGDRRGVLDHASLA